MKLLVSAGLAAAALIAAAAPALAQDVYARSDVLAQRIDNGVRDGRLSYGNAEMLRAQLRSIQRAEDRYSADGMFGWERSDLNLRLDRLSDRISTMSDYGVF